MLDRKKIVIIGATNNRADAANRAVRAYLERGYKVFAVNPSETTVEGLHAYKSPKDIHEPVYYAAFYVPAAEGLRYVDALVPLGVKQVFFHPDSASGRLILIVQGHEMDAEAVDAVIALERIDRASA